MQVDAAAQDVDLACGERRQCARTGAGAEQEHHPPGERLAIHRAPERRQFGNLEHPLARLESARSPVMTYGTEVSSPRR